MSSSSHLPAPHAGVRTSDNPGAVLLAATAARRFYIEGASKSEIAEELGISRFKVARILDQARASGLVRIEIHYEGEIDFDLSVQLASHLHLRQCLVVTTPDEDLAQLRTTIGNVLARYLSETITADDVVGVAWSRTAVAMRAALTQLPPCPFVQLTGVLSRPDVAEGSIELIRQMAQLGGGPAYCFYTPMIVPDADTAHSLRAQPEVASAMSRFRDLTKAIVSIGAWAPPYSTAADTISPADYEDAVARGVCAEVAGIQVDASGHTLHTPISDRTIGITANELRAVPEVIAAVYGDPKLQAVRAVLRAGLVTTLVTHASLATRLLDGSN
jgi:DNA-binding transcriptional regulator LsrR (DeoR family)